MPRLASDTEREYFRSVVAREELNGSRVGILRSDLPRMPALAGYAYYDFPTNQLVELEDEQALRIAASIKVDLYKLLATPPSPPCGVCEYECKHLTIADKLLECVQEINSFSALHDIMDANTLGDCENLLTIAGEEQVAADLSVIQAAQTEVDRWIKAGGLLI